MKSKGLDIIVPILLDGNWSPKEEIIDEILKQNTNYGFTRFLLCAPIGGWRSIGYPPQEFFVEKAIMFKEIKDNLLPYGIEIGWWNCLTIKSGATEGFQSIVKSNGEKHPFANCPLGEKFKNRFASDVALFAKIAKPSFIFFEDDYSLDAADGCFCELHLNEFQKRYGYKFSREELVEILKNPKEVEIIKKWRELAKMTMVDFSAVIRRELDKESPEIAMGSMQSGGHFKDGNCAEEVSRALAGTNHIPYSRFVGADYTGIKSRNIPKMLYRPLHYKQHIDNFLYYFEADTFPRTRFYTTGCQMISLMAAAFSCGFDGAIFHINQSLDNPNEDPAYGKAFRRESKKMEEAYIKSKECTLKGVGIKYDPFWNNFDEPKGHQVSLWIDCVGRFGIPYTTRDSSVVFWDETLAKHSDDKQIIEALSKTIFLDGDAAKCLCERGYTEYLGVSVGDDVSQKDKLLWDLAACEVICEPFKGELEGKNMVPAWWYSPSGNGIALDLKTINEKTQAVTEIYSYQKKFITNGMTYFENNLGGKVIVMGMTLNNNRSASLFNYRRKYLIQELIKHCCDDFCFVEKAPDVMVIENVSNNKECFSEMLTIINLCEDKLEEVALHIPAVLADFSKIHILDGDGKWNKFEFTRNENSVLLPYELHYCEPMYLLIK